MCSNSFCVSFNRRKWGVFPLVANAAVEDNIGGMSEDVAKENLSEQLDRIEDGDGTDSDEDESYYSDDTDIDEIRDSGTTSDGTLIADANDILYGKLAIIKTGETVKIVTGTMPNYAGQTQTGSGATIANKLLTVKIPNIGYYTKDSKLTVDVGTATTDQVLSGKTFTSTAGVKISGTMVNNGGSTLTSSTIAKSGSNVNITVPSTGYYTTSSKLAVSIDLLKTIDELNTDQYYADGYADGLAQSTSKEATITYNRHYHDTSSSCYVAAKGYKCGGTYYYGYDPDTSDDYHDTYCSKCNTHSANNNGHGCSRWIQTSSAYYSCGYVNGQILSATITF